VPQDHREGQFPSGRKDLFDRFLGYYLALFTGTGASRKQDLTVGRLRFVPVWFFRDGLKNLKIESWWQEFTHFLWVYHTPSRRMVRLSHK
jgi:hypothetical protein